MRKHLATLLRVSECFLSNKIFCSHKHSIYVTTGDYKTFVVSDYMHKAYSYVIRNMHLKYLISSSIVDHEK